MIIEGVVHLAMSHEIPEREVEPKQCICCPGFPSHVYGIDFVLDEYPTTDPKHFPKDLDRWLHSVYDLKKLGTGRRIRITAELIEE